MADNVVRARGRGRGRARAAQRSGGAGAAVLRPGQGPPPAAGAATAAGPAARPPPGDLQQQHQQVQLLQQQLEQEVEQQLQQHLQVQQLEDAPEPHQAPRARAPRRGAAGGGLDPEALASLLQNVSLSGEDPTEAVVRGRGRRDVGVELVKTKPEHITSKKGSSGSMLHFSANYFQLETHSDWRLYEYRVDFDPDVDHVGVRKHLLRAHKTTLGGYIFDGSVMFTSQLLTQDPSISVIELVSKRADDVDIRITIRLVGDLEIGDHHYIWFFNILMTKCLRKLKLQRVGSDFFDPAAKVKMRAHRLELWPGYITCIKQHENSILMCADITNIVVRKDTVLNLLSQIINRDDTDVKTSFKLAVIGGVVLSVHNNRSYRIYDVDFDVSPDSTFMLSSGEEISYRLYYKQRYDITISEGEQPMLVSRNKAREQRTGMSSMQYLIPELCRMTGLTDTMRNDDNIMSDLSNHTLVGPQPRISKLLRFGQQLNSEETIVQDFTNWNITLGQKLVEFDARVLETESIIQAQNNEYVPSDEVEWTKDLRCRPMLFSPNLQTWVVVVPGKLKKNTMTFVSVLQNAARAMGFRISSPIYFDINDDSAETYVDAIEKSINSENPQLIMTVVPNNRSDRYSIIKRKCYVDRAVCNQVILGANLVTKRVLSIATKVAVQINSKIGGAPWTVNMPLSNLMVVGFDVCHASTGKRYGAMVASLDKSLSRYFSAVSAHTNDEELSENLSLNLFKAVRHYAKRNGYLPSRIIIYRDGVSEEQMSYVIHHEVDMIREELGNLYDLSNTTLKMAFIIVTKTLNTRIFLKNDNAPPGTVVDDCITNPQCYDFFLVSQTVRQGTVSPTYYNVISDNVDLDPDMMQRLTYKLTHLYFNWSGTVRVPAPCQYAHKLAYLVGENLHRAPNTLLENYLYYL